MNASATSWRLKIERAKEHFGILEAEIKAWLSTNPITMTKKKDVEGRRHALVAEIVNPPALNRWSLISGDGVHNLRSALDSLLYGIAVHETGLNPPKNEARLQFPITSSAEKFNEDNNQKKIRSLSSAVQLEIENAQPYKNSYSELPPLLELLSFLDNFDKHRTLNVVAAVPHAASVYDMVQACDVTMTVSVYRTIISGKTEVVSFTIEPPNSSCDYKCEATIAICVAHSPGPLKSPFSDLLLVLRLITEEVERVVEKLEAIVGQMQNPACQNPPQASHFKIDNNGAVTLAGQMDATHVAGEGRSMSPQAEAFDKFFVENPFPGYGRRNDLSRLNPVIRRQFELIQETFNFALANVEKGIVGHVNTLPFHLDYVDADEKEKNAHAFCDAGYAFIAITMPLIGFLSDICLSLSKSPEISQVLGIQHSSDDYNHLHAVMFGILIAFTCRMNTHIIIYGHVSEEDSKRLFLGITPLVYGAKFQQQVSELVADGHAIYTVLMDYIVTTNMNGANSFYGLNADNSSLIDGQMLATVVVVVAAFLLMLPERELDENVVYAFSHPPSRSIKFFAA